VFIKKRVAAMQKDQHDPLHELELTDVWKELLGHPVQQDVVGQNEPAKPADSNIPTLESDPWSELVHAEGTEVVDLHAIRLQMSDQDVEEALQVMQEEPPSNPDRKQANK
jgi:hypothetical protein